MYTWTDQKCNENDGRKEDDNSYFQGVALGRELSSEKRHEN